jgi:hypothetical protein
MTNCILFGYVVGLQVMFGFHSGFSGVSIKSAGFFATGSG